MLNLGDATVLYQDQKVELTKNEFRILQILICSVGSARPSIAATLAW